MSNEHLLRKNDFLDQAEKDFLLRNKMEFLFEIRRKSGVSQFYEKLDLELKKQDLFQVDKYREIKEGFVKISRPAKLKLTEKKLLTERPHLFQIKSQIEEWQSLFIDFFSTKSFIEKNYAEALSDLTKTKLCLDTFRYLLDNKKDIIGLLPRQIPHGNSTKLIGKEPLLLKLFIFFRGSSGSSWQDFYDFFSLEITPPEFRYFAPHVQIDDTPIQNFHGIIVLDSLDRLSFNNCHGTLLVENWQSFYALTRMNLPCLLIWSGGWKASLLRNKLEDLPSPHYYWGDIDKEGLEIFAFLKDHLPNLQSIYMDEKTFLRFEHLKQKKEVFQGPFKHLNDLQEWYQQVCINGWQIEQEQISISEQEFKSFFSADKVK